MAADDRQGFYGYGQLHVLGDLPRERLSSAVAQALHDHHDGAVVRRVTELVGQAPWLAAELGCRLPNGGAAADDVDRAWEAVVASREAEHFALLRGAGRAHRLAVPLLRAVARGEGLYSSRASYDLSRADISRTLVALEAASLVHRLGEGRWRVPTLAAWLAITR